MRRWRASGGRWRFGLDAGVLTSLGAALHNLKRYPQALASYDRALTLRPDFIRLTVRSETAMLE